MSVWRPVLHEEEFGHVSKPEDEILSCNLCT